MEPIKNIEKYTSGMKKSLIDKIFFVDKIPFPFDFLDFGCADGALINVLAEMFSENSYIGYDIDSKMIELAFKNNENNINTHFENTWNNAFNIVMAWKNKIKVLNLSSIVHEIYSYSSYEEIEDFWTNKVFNNLFNYIVIRDMVPSNSINRESYINDVRKIYKSANKDILSSYQDKWGSINNFKNMSHFLLKYRYVENWDRELLENYLPITIEELFKKIPNNYDIVYSEHYCLPFLHDVIEKDFNIDFNEPIHFKIILKRK